ncbi:hypothetical protein C7C46_01555 [Streptomyces tateyamensis]|uniref:Uncharacterized protein n=1 Tax=Streptomyces tateyamensis TaxID=565073 RepID=A0A2V4PPB4_9ACTN|nr:hypothetical protein [Streptomyces tateyamensis]PYC88156.1 hypothetical protein C7C46_01555 [Streptomyces tateyamensis]
MTAPGPARPTPGSAAIFGRPVGVALVLPLFGLLVALLVLLPSAGTAHAAAPPPAPGAAATAKAGAMSAQAGPAHHRAVAPAHGTKAGSAAPSPLAPPAWCSSDAPDQVPGHGCSSHPFCGQDAQLPNAPPQPGAAQLPLLVAPSAVPAGTAAQAVARPAPSPDLHLLQVNRP